MNFRFAGARRTHSSMQLCLIAALATCALFGAACTGAEEGPPGLDNIEDESLFGPERVKVCFTVHVPGDPTDYTVLGTLVEPRSFRSSTTVLLLQHGVSAERSVFDGRRGVTFSLESLAVKLAREDYGVFIVDRLGYGQSTYPNSGFDLTIDAYIEMTNDMVTQIRNGTYRTTRSSCGSGEQADFGSSKVVVGGFSAGSGVASAYATRYSDAVGVMNLVWSNQGFSSTFFNLIETVVVPQLEAGADNVFLFPPPDDNGVELCEEAMLFTPGMKRRVVDDICGEYWPGRLTPGGETFGGPQAEIIANIGNIGVPTLLMFADRDELFPNEDFRGQNGMEPDLVTPEIDLWTQGCNCSVTVRWARNSGHDLMAHSSLDDQADDIIDWLEDEDL